MRSPLDICSKSAIRISDRRSFPSCHSGTSARCHSWYRPAGSKLAPSGWRSRSCPSTTTLERRLRLVIPGAYRSAMKPSLRVTTESGSLPLQRSKAASTASLTFAMSSSDGGGSSGFMSPVSHACFKASGKLLCRASRAWGFDSCPQECHAPLIPEVNGGPDHATGALQRCTRLCSWSTTGHQTCTPGAEQWKVTDVVRGGCVEIKGGDEHCEDMTLAEARPRGAPEGLTGWSDIQSTSKTQAPSRARLVPLDADGSGTEGPDLLATVVKCCV